jgi:predicted GIY-YIG superfamily endonuclease
MAMVKLRTIYILRCPITGAVRYVGNTNRPKERYKQHINDVKPPYTEKKFWLLWLREQGKIPILEVVKNIEDPEEALKCERENVIANIHTVFNLYIPEHWTITVADYRRQHNIEYKPTFNNAENYTDRYNKIKS